MANRRAVPGLLDNNGAKKMPSFIKRWHLLPRYILVQRIPHTQRRENLADFNIMARHGAYKTLSRESLIFWKRKGGGEIYKKI
jgi:hypothetical protein